MANRPNPSLTITEAALYRGISVSTIRRMISRGELRAYRIGPRIIRIDPADLDRVAVQVAPATYAHVSGGDAA